MCPCLTHVNPRRPTKRSAGRSRIGWLLLLLWVFLSGCSRHDASACLHQDTAGAILCPTPPSTTHLYLLAPSSRTAVRVPRHSDASRGSERPSHRADASRGSARASGTSRAPRICAPPSASRARSFKSGCSRHDAPACLHQDTAGAILCPTPPSTTHLYLLAPQDGLRPAASMPCAPPSAPRARPSSRAALPPCSTCFNGADAVLPLRCFALAACWWGRVIVATVL